MEASGSDTPLGPHRPSRPRRIRQRSTQPPGIPRLSTRTIDNDTLACQRCHSRKKKTACVYDILISDRSHPNFIANLMAENASQRERIAQLEAHVATLAAQAVGDGLSYDPLSGYDPGPAAPIAPAEHGVPDLAPPAALPPLSPAPSRPTNAERIVLQILTSEIDSRDASMSFSGTIGQQLGTSAADEARHSSEKETPAGKRTSAITTWPPEILARKLLDLFFNFSSGFYPFLNRAELENDLNHFYSQTKPNPPSASDFSTPDARVYRLLMLFACGCNLFEQHRNYPRTDTSSLRTYAFEHFPAVLRGDDVTCVSGIILLTIYSIFDFVRLSPYRLIGVCTRLVVELGWHQDDPTLPLEQQDARRRLFWVTFCLDRMISASLTKAVLIPENIVTTQFPTKTEGSSVVSSYLSQDDFFRHVIRMRRMVGVVLTDVYLAESTADGEATQLRVRNQLDDWFDSVPRPPQGSSVTHHPFFELSYNLLLTQLYSPSPLMAHTHPIRMSTLRRAAFRTVELYRDLHKERRLAENYVHLSSIVTASVSLLYTLIENEGDRHNADLSSWRREALRQTAVCEDLFGSFCVNWPSVERFRDAFGLLAQDVKTRFSTEPAAPAANTNLPAQRLASAPGGGTPVSTPGRMLITTSPVGVPTSAFDLTLFDGAATGYTPTAMHDAGGLATPMLTHTQPSTADTTRNSEQAMWDAWLVPAVLEGSARDDFWPTALFGTPSQALFATVGLGDLVDGN